MLLILLCNKRMANENVLWSVNLKGELITAQIYNNSMIILTGTFGLKCLDMENGKIKWTDKEDELVFTLNKPFLYNRNLYTGTDKSNKIYNIDIDTGSYQNIYDVSGIVLLTKVFKNQLYYIVRENGYSRYKIKILDLDSWNENTIFEFKDYIEYIRDPLIIHKNYIIASIKSRNDRNLLYCINKDNGSINWETEIAGRQMRLTNVIKHNDSVFWVEKGYLIEKNIETGVTNSLQKENINGSYMEFDGEHILIYGMMKNKGSKNEYYTQLYLYNVNDKNIISIQENYNKAVISNGRIIYKNNNKIFLKHIVSGESREIYSYREELVHMYVTEKFLLLVLTNDEREVHLGYGSCKYVLISLKDID